MKAKIKVAQFGLGPIGIECLKLAASANWATVIGAVDINPARIGTKLESWTGTKHLRGLRVVDSVDRLQQKPDLVFHTAVSRFAAAYPQIEPLARRGIHVVSS